MQLDVNFLSMNAGYEAINFIFEHKLIIVEHILLHVKSNVTTLSLEAMQVNGSQLPTHFDWTIITFCFCVI